MSHSDLLLGLDVGTTRIKAQLFDVGGAVVASASAPTPFVHRGGATEMAVEQLLVAVAQVLEGLGDERERVVAVGIAGMAESGAPLDADNRPLAPVIAWHDPRGTTVVDRLERKFGAVLASRIGQRPRAVSSVAKLGWLVDHGIGEVCSWLGVPELCLSALTGARGTDYSLAARTGCYDVARRAWIHEVPQALGLPVSVFPPVRPAGTPTGRVATSATGWSGLPSGIPVTLAGHDHLAALVGSGAGPGDLGNSVGTAETVVARCDRLPDIAQALGRGCAVTLMATGDAWAVLAGAARAGPVLDAASRALGLPLAELDRLARGSPSVDASELLATAEADHRRGSGAAGEPLRLPAGSPGSVWRGLLEALATRTGDAVQRAVDVSGPASRLVVFGGGSRSRPWLQAKAEAVDLPVWRSTADEAAARGAALCAGVAAGWWLSTADGPRAHCELVVGTGRDADDVTITNGGDEGSVETASGPHEARP